MTEASLGMLDTFLLDGFLLGFQTLSGVFLPHGQQVRINHPNWLRAADSRLMPKGSMTKAQLMCFEATKIEPAQVAKNKFHHNATVHLSIDSKELQALSYPATQEHCRAMLHSWAWRSARHLSWRSRLGCIARTVECWDAVGLWDLPSSQHLPWPLAAECHEHA